MKRVLEYSSIAAMAFIMVVTLFILLAPQMGWRIDTIVGDSMSPTLETGDMVISRPVDPAYIMVGDTITYHSPIDGQLVTHRVVEIQGHGELLFQTKGDACEHPDPYLVPPENIVGMVGLNIPLMGYISSFVKTPLGATIALVIPCLIIIGVELIDIRYTLLERRRESVRRTEDENEEDSADTPGSHGGVGAGCPFRRKQRFVQ